MENFDEYLRQGEPNQAEKRRFGKQLSACNKWMV